MDRREWMRRGSALGALSLLSGSSVISSLTAEEKAKFNPRDLEFPIQLNFNENPFGPSEKVRQAMIDAFKIGCRYPDTYSQELLDMISEKEGVSRDHIVITGGSTEGLKITGSTFANNGGEIIAARPTFLAMMMYAKQWGATINWVDLDKNLTHDVDEMERRISAKTKLIFLCNPNNPTSTLLSKNKLIDFCTAASKKTIVFSDEAYYDFIEEKDYPSMTSLVKKGENVIVSRTFSKVYGLAGLRIGYLIAKPELANKIRDNVVAYTNVLALKAAASAMQDKEFYQFSLRKVNECKQIMYAAMDELKLEYIKSNTNFIFFKTGRDIDIFNRQMLAEGVKVGRAFPPYTDWCRISTGTVEEVQYFAEKLKKVLS
ncbi:histidinol-phosphate transaminase [Roseivirga sp. E12]|uniref:pyridoxal phosphate-dependent aminotransferase n=1 Tax=Roseivirga sp. E12 TaxID=2819237 RepID=UPI001ABCFFBC|nr:histidinol-phosphate transaminase [Roseivirga sp. E12]MBO3696979.1 aminotransferase class I/II-fold pyridoxal phosphate-dependent enzyme [Roseivirga sp. E12]